MIKFYDVDINYINFLKKYDKQIPNIKYSSANKFVCGIVLHINSINYFAPISSNIIKQRTSMLIRNKRNQPISSIKFSFMFPAYFNVLTLKDFSEIRKTNTSYADLLETEYDFCKTHQQEILNKAKSVYDIGTNPNHKLNYTCCDFKTLEKVYQLYGTGLEVFSTK